MFFGGKSISKMDDNEGIPPILTYLHFQVSNFSIHGEWLQEMTPASSEVVLCTLLFLEESFVLKLRHGYGRKFSDTE